MFIIILHYIFPRSIDIFYDINILLKYTVDILACSWYCWSCCFTSVVETINEVVPEVIAAVEEIVDDIEEFFNYDGIYIIIIIIIIIIKKWI